MERLCERCVGRYGVYNLLAEQAEAHPSSRVDAVLAISEREWEGMLIDCITRLPRV
jgi:hypothetical protein